MYAYTYTYVHAGMYAYTCTYITHVCMYIYLHTCIYIHTYIFTYIYTHAQIYTHTGVIKKCASMPLPPLAVTLEAARQKETERETETDATHGVGGSGGGGGGSEGRGGGDGGGRGAGVEEEEVDGAPQIVIIAPVEGETVLMAAVTFEIRNLPRWEECCVVEVLLDTTDPNMLVPVAQVNRSAQLPVLVGMYLCVYLCMSIHTLC